jgi:hypothetical protein
MKENDIKRLVEEYLIPGVMVQMAKKNEEMLVFIREIKERLDDLEAHKHDHPHSWENGSTSHVI